jgi:hypothetical protein
MFLAGRAVVPENYAPGKGKIRTIRKIIFENIMRIPFLEQSHISINIYIFPMKMNIE